MCEMELVRTKLEKLITITYSFINSEVISLSQELDKLILKYYLCEKIELLRNKLEKLVAITDSLVNSEVVSLSQELDKLILKYYLCEV